MIRRRRIRRRERIINVMANAIGWELYSLDGRTIRPYVNEDGIKTQAITLTEDEVAVTRHFATIAYEALLAHRGRV